MYVQDSKYRNKLIKIDVYVNNYINNKTFEDLIYDIELLKNFNNEKLLKESKLVYICYITQYKGNLINKLIEKNKKNDLIIFIFNKELQNIEEQLDIIENNFKNYLVFKSNNYNNEIIPLLQIVNIIRNEIPKIDYLITINDYNLKHDETSKKIIDESIDYLLSESLDYYINSLDYYNSNLLAKNNSFKEISGNNQIVLLSKYEDIYDINKKYVLGNNFFCEMKILNSILKFIENNNYRGYFFNNLYDKNLVLYLNSPAEFISILFGTIKIIYNTNNIHKNKIKLNISKPMFLSNQNDFTDTYLIVKEKKNKEYINNNLWLHLHCYNINYFDDIFGNYVDELKKKYSIVLSYQIGDKLPLLDIKIIKINYDVVNLNYLDSILNLNKKKKVILNTNQDFEKDQISFKNIINYLEILLNQEHNIFIENVYIKNNDNKININISDINLFFDKNILKEDYTELNKIILKNYENVNIEEKILELSKIEKEDLNQNLKIKNNIFVFDFKYIKGGAYLYLQNLVLKYSNNLNFIIFREFDDRYIITLNDKKYLGTYSFLEKEKFYYKYEK